MSTPETLPLSFITSWSSGGTPNRSNPAFWNGTIPWISAATLKGSRIATSDQYLTEAGLRAGSKLAPVGATLVLVRGMALHRETRIGLVERRVSFNQDVKALVPKPGVLPEFLLFALQARSKEIRDLVSSAGSGTGVLNTQLLQRLPIWVPNERTQRAVVQAMSDADNLITTLERRLAKKQAIKQGMMQQLVTGRTRLPSFTDPWSEAGLGTLGICIRGVSYDPDTDLSPADRPFTARLLRSNNIQDGRIERSGLQFVHERRVSSIQEVRPGDIVICMANGSRALVGKAALFDGTGDGQRYTFGAFMGVFRADQSVAVPKFVSEMMRTHSFRTWLDLKLSGSSINNLRPGDIEGFAARVPARAEQQAIADVLGDVDIEIDLLGARLNKARDTKTGMMQQLLTGRTRLPVEVSA